MSFAWLFVSLSCFLLDFISTSRKDWLTINRWISVFTGGKISNVCFDITTFYKNMFRINLVFDQYCQKYIFSLATFLLYIAIMCTIKLNFESHMTSNRLYFSILTVTFYFNGYIISKFKELVRLIFTSKIYFCFRRQ